MDSSYLAPTTELDAVNAMLLSIGESPINTLDGALPADALIATQILGRVSREIQSQGWHFNSETAVPLTPDVNGFVTLPSNVARVDINQGYHPSLDCIQRGLKLYNRSDHTYVFSLDTVYVDIVYLLAFTDLPETARKFIIIRAGRKFQDQVVGSGTLHDFTQEDEMWAKIDMENAEAESADYNILHAIPHVMRRRSLIWR